MKKPIGNAEEGGGRADIISEEAGAGFEKRMTGRQALLQPNKKLQQQVYQE